MGFRVWGLGFRDTIMENQMEKKMHKGLHRVCLTSLRSAEHEGVERKII